MSFYATFCGWRPCGFADYQQAYTLFGGSVMADPRILAFLNDHLPLQASFQANYDRKGQLRGAVCLWDKHNIAGDKRYLQHNHTFHYPLNTDEIALPLQPGKRLFLPWKTRFLSPLTAPHIYNASHTFNARRQLCLAHPLKRKTRLARKNELKRFIQAGGGIHPLTEFSQQDRIDIFIDLMYQRRQIRLDPAPLQTLLTAIPDLLFGHILTFQQQPCAMQWIVKSEDHHHVWLDYVNNAMTLALPKLYIGSVLSWLNISSAFDYAQQHGKTLRYSFGMPSARYKDIWCERLPLYRVLAC